MKIGEILNFKIPAPGRGLKTYEIFGLNKGRSRELKNILDKMNKEGLKPITDIMAKIPKSPNKSHVDMIQNAIDQIIPWTAPRRFIELMAELDVRNINEANYIVMSFTLEMFNRIATNQNHAVDLNNILKLAEKTPVPVSEAGTEKKGSTT